MTDHISIGVLTRAFPAELVDGVVAEAERRERRQRLLPARVVVYYVLALALFADCSYEEVMRQLVEGLAWESGWEREWAVPSKMAISKARARLGREPLELLFRAVAVPLASESTRGAFYRGLRLVSVDGTCLDVADTPANEAEFGRPGSSRREGGGAFPQVRMVALAESGTHAIFDAALGPYSSAERELADRLWGSLSDAMLCLADRGFYSFECTRVAGGGASGAVSPGCSNVAHGGVIERLPLRLRPRLSSAHAPHVASSFRSRRRARC
ncbi:MAG: IS4 family transposase, partial [Trebonia sp.]